MSTHVMVTVTDQGLFIPNEIFAGFGEIEIVRLADSIVIQPKSTSRTHVIELLQQTGYLLSPPPADQAGDPISPEQQAELAGKFSIGRPLSEIIIEERNQQW